MSEVIDFRDTWRRAVERFPNRTAVQVAENGASTSYAELHSEASYIADTLYAAGARAGHLVGLRINDRRRFCAGLLGAWLADTVPVPLSASAPSDYVEELVRRLGARVVLADNADSGHGLTASPVATMPMPDVAEGRSLAYVMHTSGSTGRPKAVAVSHRALAAYCTAFTTATRLTHEDRFLQVAPVTFDVVFEELLPIWCVGGTAVLATGVPEDPRRLLVTLGRRRVTVAELTTVYWRLLVRYLTSSSGTVPECLRLLLVGGETASIDLIEDSLRVGLPLAHVYGVTEAAITSTIEFFESSGPVRSVSVGTPLAHSTIHVVDDQGIPVPSGATGEVWIGGDGLAEGYLGLPDETARRFVDATGETPPAGRYYRTGDVGRIGADGGLEILGRLDDEVKVNGRRVDLNEVEAALVESPLVAEAAVVAVLGPDGARRLHCAVVPAARVPPLDFPGTLRRSLEARLPRHLVPDYVVMVDALPVTEHGKVDRKALGACIAAVNGGLVYARSTTPTERLILAAWTAAMGVSLSNLDQNFGDAGGDSLAMIALVVQLGKLGVTVTSTDCLTYPTIRKLAAFLDRTNAGRTTPPDMAVGEQDEMRGDLRRRRFRQRRVAKRAKP